MFLKYSHDVNDLPYISPVNPHGLNRSPRSSHHPCAGWLASLGRVAPARAGAAVGRLYDVIRLYPQMNGI